MKNLILDYFEDIDDLVIETGDLRYCNERNLTVDINNNPAISKINMSTNTSTKTFSEVSDSDHDRNSILMGTKTKTFTSVETSDADRDIRLNLLMVTQTLTESQEVTDADR